MNIITILVAILCFGIITMIHEAGHFFVAKNCGIRVLEFSIGMGPAIFSKKHKGTKYSLRVFPIGGYCAMEGEDEESGWRPGLRSISTRADWPGCPPLPGDGTGFANAAGAWR